MARSNSRKKPNGKSKKFPKPHPTTAVVATHQKQAEFLHFFNNKQWEQAVSAAKDLTESFPFDSFGWKALGTSLLEQGNAESAIASLERALTLDENDAISLTNLASAYYHQGQYDDAIACQLKAVELEPNYAHANYRLAGMLEGSGQAQRALFYIEKACSLGYDEHKSLLLRSTIESKANRPQDALKTTHLLLSKYPDSEYAHNNAGNFYKDIGQHEKAEIHFRRAFAINPNSVLSYSNLFFAMHYNPSASAKKIFDLARQWDGHFSLPLLPPRDPSLDNSQKALRIGLISSGFCQHPVGLMIQDVLPHIGTDIDLYAYSVNDVDDFITQKLKISVHTWRYVRHLSQQKLADLLREDEIDITIDLSGHSDGSRLQALSMRPSPINIKWVGGLANTMGTQAIDYLISDHHETPEGVDDMYVEKLIRMPDDYICYTPTDYTPTIKALPSLTNGYVTLGCFNNAAKVNPQLLKEWAKILHQLPNSRLFLKSAAYATTELKDEILQKLCALGIGKERVSMEGSSPHVELLEAYHRVDIALDTWPYSGGLTTCEALLMGVPVVTLPGPTFAGRHSATHLANAGMPELVVDSWEAYRARVIEMASDLPNLAVIRACLRQYLLQSTVCDGPKFARHLHKALRAIWQRHCEGKSPAALSFKKGGQAWFADEEKPYQLPDVIRDTKHDWAVDTPLIVLDNGAAFAQRGDIRELLGKGCLVPLIFDPLGQVNNSEELAQYGQIQHFPNVMLGSGEPETLKLPLPESEAHWPASPSDRTEEVQVPTIALDSIEGLPSVELLVLGSDNAMTVLKHGERTVLEVLCILIKPSHIKQTKQHNSKEELVQWAESHSFMVHYPRNVNHDTETATGSEMHCNQEVAQLDEPLVLIANNPRQERMTSLQKKKLDYLLEAILGAGTERQLEAMLAMEESQDGSYPTPTGNVAAKSEALMSVLGERRILFLATGDMANHGIIQKGQNRVMEALSTIGVSTEWANEGKQTGTGKLIELARDRRNVFYCGNRYYDATISISGIDEQNMFDVFSRPVIASVADHPYATFMLPRIEKASRHALLTGRKSLIEEVRFMRPDMEFARSPSKGIKIPLPRIETRHYERDIDVLIPMNITYALLSKDLEKNLLSYAERIGEKSHQLVLAVLEKYKDFSVSLLDEFRSMYSLIFKKEWRVSLPWSDEDKSLFQLLSMLDDTIRGKERLNALRAVAKTGLNKNYKIVVLADENSKRALKTLITNSSIDNWLFTGTIHTSTMPGIYQRSRCVLNVNPTYHDAIHERVRDAAVYGCALISNKNEALTRLFKHRQSIMFYDENDTLAEMITNKQLCQSIAHNSNRIVHDHFADHDGKEIFNIFSDYLKWFDSNNATEKRHVF